MSSSSRDFFDIAQYLFDREAWIKRMRQHGVVAMLQAANKVEQRLAALESQGYQFEPPFCEDAFPCLIR